MLANLRLAAISDEGGQVHKTVDPSAPGVKKELSDRDLIQGLDTEIKDLRGNVETLIEHLHTERVEWEEKLLKQREQLQRDIEIAFRQGWQLILTSLAFSAVGTAVGMFG